MEAKVIQLIKLIGEEVVIFETFLRLLNEQQEAIVANNIEQLQQTTLAQEQLATRTSRIEQQRDNLARELSGELKRDQRDLNLSELAKLVAEPQSQQIKALQETLLSLHGQITEIKNRNDFLIKKSMEYINTTMSYLASTGEAHSTYTPDQQRSTKISRALVDRRA